MPGYIDPLVMFVGYLMTLLLLIGLITTFIRSKYFAYKDMEILMSVFILFVVMVALYAGFYGMRAFSFSLNVYSEVLIRCLASFAAWLFAMDQYRNVRWCK